MRIYIQVPLGVLRTYEFDVEPTLTLFEFKIRFCEELKTPKDLQKIWFIYNNSLLDDDTNSLEDCHVEDESVLQYVDLYDNAVKRNNFNVIGIKFVDVNDKKGLKKVAWAKTSPPWRIARPGLCLEGLCSNTQCAAHGQSVIISFGYEKINIADIDETTSKCPMCNQFVNPQTCAFNNCWWRYYGKKPNTKDLQKQPIKCSCEWQYADNAYHYIDQNGTEIVTWLILTIHAVKDKPIT
ncbi:hypothetical protein I4U23_023535 [Adineta vaga]|nr:hypothetical protein I4U23_023535 [Adineta vaga]